ncbi:CD225/dispanin family protein [Xanthomonas campestris]|uniref:CD225/dispanin family protein n=1 Tax=Xanthomonas campestris TaxID=339 RepID=UPI001E54026E|nr:CD225/dispanin family protein [Xanthomonas campestris]MCC4605792.1 CD225/dispanin family protein [Xanthomonas campestris pv. parthenii]
MSAIPPPIQPPPAMSTPPLQPIRNHLVWSIVMTVLCVLICCSCWTIPGIVTGIVAIVFAAKVNPLLNAGDIQGAIKASNTAKVLAWVTTAIFALGLILWVVSIASLGVDGYREKILEMQQQIESSR